MLFQVVFGPLDLLPAFVSSHSNSTMEAIFDLGFIRAYVEKLGVELCILGSLQEMTGFDVHLNY